MVDAANNGAGCNQPASTTAAKRARGASLRGNGHTRGGDQVCPIVGLLPLAVDEVAVAKPHSAAMSFSSTGFQSPELRVDFWSAPDDLRCLGLSAAQW